MKRSRNGRVASAPAVAGGGHRSIESIGFCFVCFLVQRLMELHFGDGFGAPQLLAPLYFPRSAAEAESSRYQLPFDIGHPVSGEPVINDRRIRIIDNPQHTFHGALLLLFPSSHSVPSFFCSRLGNSVTTR